MLILGIDASLNSLGYCILNEKKEIILLNTIIPDKKVKSQSIKLKKIYNELDRIMKSYSITEIILEDIYRGPSILTFKLLANLQGGIELLSFQNNILLRKITTCTMKSHILKTEIKQPKKIKGQPKQPKTDFKEKVRINIIERFNLPQNTSNDITDSLALAICGVEGIYDIKKIKKVKK